jgi:hypothetical protein
MTYSKTADLETVLDEYAHASEDFDAEVLNAFLQKYPEHASALHRYAQVQLTFAQPTREEVEEEELSDEEMLPLQSKLLQRLQQLRAEGPPSDVASDDNGSDDAAMASEKLAAISGEGLAGVAQRVFSSAEHGEDLLLLALIDTPSGITGIPNWFAKELGGALACPPGAIVQALALKRQRPAQVQRFSAKEKPTDSPPIGWRQLVEDCITDEVAKKTILERTERS